MATFVDEHLASESVGPDGKSDVRGILAGTLRSEPFCLRYGLSAPICVLIHGVALGIISAASLLTTASGLSPVPARMMVMQFAPPPPPPLRQGSPAVSTTPEPSAPTTRAFVPQSFAMIPEDVLAPSFEPTLEPDSGMGFGAELGFEDGNAYGMVGGMSAGVVGGVPGGLPGGVVGGTGNDLPRFPKADVGPRPIRMPKPSYTEAAIREKVAGSVVLRVVIDEQGRVEVLKVLRSIPELDDEAIRLVEAGWRFEPATKNGRPVPVISDLVVRFHLY